MHRQNEARPSGHQVIQDVYAGEIVSQAKLAKTQYMYFLRFWRDGEVSNRQTIARPLVPRCETPP